jgi:transposase
MLTLYGNARIFLYQNPTNMRKSFEGLSTAVQEAFPDLLMSGSYFVFLNKRRDCMKVLYWDSDGFSIWYKRLEKGSFSRKCSLILDRKQFLMLLEGITPKRVQKRYQI